MPTVKRDDRGQMWIRQDDQSWIRATMVSASPDGSIVVQTQEDYETMPDEQIKSFRDSRTPDEQGYNGWTNYETWAVNLHLTNDESLYLATLQCQNANEIKQFVDDMIEGLLYGNCDHLSPTKLLLQDLVGTGLQSVNWREIYDVLHEGEELEND